MFASRALSRQRWVCQSCLQKAAQRRTASSRRHAPAAGAAAAAQFDLPASYPSSDIQNDDRTLRQVFDSSDFWKDFSSKQKYHYGRNKHNAGLFQNRYLYEPAGFERWANDVLQRCQRIVAKVLQYDSVAQYKRIARDMDRLSDLLCRVIDLSYLIALKRSLISSSLEQKLSYPTAASS